MTASQVRRAVGKLQRVQVTAKADYWRTRARYIATVRVRGMVAGVTETKEV